MAGAPPAERWFLSFDCALKSFAWALVRVRRPRADTAERAAAAVVAVLRGRGGEGRAAAEALAAEARGLFHLAAGGAADLAPGRADKEVSRVERLGYLDAYLRGPVAAALAAAAAEGCPPPTSKELHVAVEYQMGANAHSGTIADGLHMFYIRAHTFPVGPALKNKLWHPAFPRIRHCYYLEKYTKPYAANKAHSRDYFYQVLVPTYGLTPPPGVAARHRADFADSVTQVLGILLHGDLATAASKY